MQLHLILYRGTIVNIESIDDAPNLVKAYIKEHNLRPELYLAGQVFDDDENLVAIIEPDGVIVTGTSNPDIPEFWKFNQLALKIMTKDSK